MINLKSLKLILALSISIAVVYITAVATLGLFMPNHWNTELEGSEFSQLSNGKVRYSEIGSGSDTILFLHGFNSQMSIWNRVWDKLDHCHHSIRLDIPGFGQSTWDSESYTLEEQSKRLYEFVKSKKLNKLTLVGASMGGALSITFASLYPDLVKSLILIAPSGYPGSLIYRKPFTELIKTNWFRPAAIWIAESRLYKFAFPKSIALQSLTVTSSYNNQWVENLKSIESQVILIWSTGDTAVDYKYASSVSSKLKNNSLITLPENINHNAPNLASSLISDLACYLAKNETINKPELLNFKFDEIK